MEVKSEGRDVRYQPQSDGFTCFHCSQTLLYINCNKPSELLPAGSGVMDYILNHDGLVSEQRGDLPSPHPTLAQGSQPSLKTYSFRDNEEDYPLP